MQHKVVVAAMYVSNDYCKYVNMQALLICTPDNRHAVCIAGLLHTCLVTHLLMSFVVILLSINCAISHIETIIVHVMFSPTVGCY